MKTKKNRWGQIVIFYKNRHFDLCRINKFEIIQNLPFNFGLSRVRILERLFQISLQNHPHKTRIFVRIVKESFRSIDSNPDILIFCEETYRELQFQQKNLKKISAVPQKSAEKVHKPFKKWMYKTRFYLHIVKGIKKVRERF